ncbi:hypothetical protein D3C81_1580350 [compost metagenome]
MALRRVELQLGRALLAVLKVVQQGQAGDSLLSVDDVEQTALAPVAPFLVQNDAAQVEIMRRRIAAKEAAQILEQPLQLLLAPAVGPLILRQMQPAEDDPTVAGGNALAVEHVVEARGGDSDALHVQWQLGGKRPLTHGLIHTTVLVMDSGGQRPRRDD